MTGSLSERLREIAADEGRERVFLGELAEALGDQALGALMFVLAAPNLLPSPPGTSILVGPPLLFLSAQLVAGRALRLPRRIASQSMSRDRFASWIGRMAPWLERAERLLRPRLGFAVRGPARVVVGALGVILAAILFLPIPLGNVLPALAICLMALGLVERDGLWVVAGAATALAAIGVVGAVLYALARLAGFVVSHTMAV